MPPNVLLVVWDTVRAQNVSAYGHTNKTTPFLDEFSNRATLYEQARAPAARSLDSHASIFTGLHVEEHNVVSIDDALAPGNTVWEALAGEGYATGVFSENNWLTDVDAGLKDAFDRVEGPRNVPFPDAADPTTFVAEEGQGEYGAFLRQAVDPARPGYSLQSLWNGAAIKLQSDYPAVYRTLSRDSVGTPGATYTDLFLDWIDSVDGPWAACVNYMDAHHPYEPIAEYDAWGGKVLRDLQDDVADVKWEFNGGQRPWWQRRALEGLYDGCIRELDAELERLVDELKSRGEFDDTLLVVLSDHGEGFGEPSRVRPGVRIASHSDAAHECLLHVPLIVKYPGQSEGRQITDTVSLTDFRHAVKATFDGKSGDPFVTEGPVIATVHGLDGPVRERASRYVDDLTPFTATARVVFESGDGTVEKYVTWRDVEKTIRIRDAQTAWIELEGGGDRVDAAFADISDAGVNQADGRSDELSAQSRQQLKDLGYV